ncbi:MAG: glutamate--tRNA ligase [Sulfolobales archaeon]|nr:glutamate--tRNA ligase [Sulfolobales archaeon]MCX8186796.1 glutamate--tRNA ligase [Sulfolobales archaeon]MDW7969871.1 glutamate--tRNA ligase [Sulfolobales archaeon]
MSMSEKFGSEVRDLILKLALKNAVDHDGKASVKPVLGKVLGTMPDLRKVVKELEDLVSEIVAEVNRMSHEDQIRLLREYFPDTLVERKEAQLKVLPPLPNVGKYKEVRTRFAPNPDFLIHLGNARPAILSYEYAKEYKGKFILRFEDTDPKTKQPLPEAYSAIREDLNWLGVKWDEEYIQSLRMGVYYSVARELISVGGAYVDLCRREEFIKYKIGMKPCPHRDASMETNLDLWDKMVSNYFGEGDAVLRVKTDLLNPDPSLRDWVAFRVINTDKNPHPVVGSKYWVWPTYNFAAGVDDHLMSVTHILRGKEHTVNTLKQKYLYQHLNWEYPEVINLGRLKLEGFILSKSKIKELLAKHPERFKSMDDIRFGTIASLRNRGILAETIRKVILEVGVKSSDAAISWENVAAINRKLVDSTAKRLMFVSHPPKKVLISSVPQGVGEVSIPLHPTNKELGTRKIRTKLVEGKLEVYIDSHDLDKFKDLGYVRLMEFMNIRYVGEGSEGVLAEFVSTDLSDAKRFKAPIIQWIPNDDFVRVIIYRPDNLNLLRIRGYGESYMKMLRVGEVVQLVRYGFVKVKGFEGNVMEATYIHD